MENLSPFVICFYIIGIIRIIDGGASVNNNKKHIILNMTRRCSWVIFIICLFVAWLRVALGGERRVDGCRVESRTGGRDGAPPRG